MAILTKHVLMGKDIVRGALSGELLVADQAGGFSGKSLDTALAALVAKIIADDASGAATALAGRNALSAAATAESTARQNAEGVIQADVNANEASAATDRALIRTQFAAADAAEVVARDAAIATAVASLIDSAPGALDTLNELAASIGDDANYAATVTNSLATLQADVNANEADGDTDRALIRTQYAAADTSAAAFNLAARNAIIAQHGADDGAAATARGVIQADVDANETAAATARGVIQADVDANEVASVASFAAATAARAALQADVDGNEADADASFVAAASARGVIQADVDANEADADASFGAAATDRALIRTQFAAADAAEVTARNSAISAAVASLIDSAPGALDTLNELAAAMGDDANFGSTVSNSIAAVQADVNQNEADADASFGAAATDRAAVRSEFAAADVSAASFNLAARNAIIAQHGADDGAAATARGVIQADVNANEAAEKLRMDHAGGFHAESTASSWALGWGANKPRVSFAIDSGVVTMSVDVEPA